MSVQRRCSRLRPAATVVVPVYNVAAYLDQCLESIRNQTFTDFEVVVVDDASTDESPRIIETHARVDSRIRHVRHSRNLGLGAARNTGIRAARGAVVFFVDSDDVVSHLVVETGVRLIREWRADVLVFDHWRLDSQLPQQKEQSRGTESIELPLTDFLLGQYFAWSKCVRRDLLVGAGVLFPEGVCYEDAVFHWELGLVAQRIVSTRAALYGYRSRPGSISLSTGAPVVDQVEAQRGISNCLQSHRADARLWRIFLRRCMHSLLRAYRVADDATVNDVIEREVSVVRLLRNEAPKGTWPSGNLGLFGLLLGHQRVARTTLRLARRLPGVRLSTSG